MKTGRSIRICDGVCDRGQDEGKPKGQGGEHEAQIVPGGREQRVDGVTSLAEEEVPVQPSVGLHVADGGLNGRSSPQLTTHSDSEAASAAGDHHLARAGVVVAAIALVDVDPFGLDARRQPSGL